MKKAQNPLCGIPNEKIDTSSKSSPTSSVPVDRSDIATSTGNAPAERQPSRRRIRRFNARQRKKFAVGEFQEFMFEVTIRFAPEFGPDSVKDFLDAFLRVLESRSLTAGACASDELLDAMVVAGPRSMLRETDRVAIETWISEQGNVATFAVGELIDANYGVPQD